MGTLVLSGDGRWSLGENTFFLRVFTGDFVDGQSQRTGSGHLMYAEWTSRLSLAAMRNRREGPGLVRDVFVATQINRGGTGFSANLIGAGVKLRGPFALLSTSSLYYRRAPGDSPGMKFRTSWAMPIALGRVPPVFEGSEDIVTGGPGGTDVNGMPAIMLDVGALASRTPGTLHAGIEWFHHWTPSSWTDVPQLTMRRSYSSGRSLNVRH